MLVLYVLALLTAFAVLVTALINLRVARANQQKIDSVHVLVNGRLEEAMEEIRRLEQGLQK